MHKRVVKYAIYAFFILAFVWVSAQLFFERETDQVLASVRNVFFAQEQEKYVDNLRVIYPDEVVGLEPTLLDPASRQRLNNVYESLVKMDRDFNIQPSLALSFGIIDDKTWEFKLRPNATFHDGSKFDSQDVLASINRAKDYSGSELAGLLTTIEDMNVVSDNVVRIKTFNPDPLLLQRLSTVLIIPAEYEKEQYFDPIGTGSYKFDSFDPDSQLTLKRFKDYWGEPARYKGVTMIVRTNKSERVNMFLSGEAELLAFLPFDAVDAVTQRGFEITSIPSLEVQFLLFNMQSDFFKNLKNRQLVSLAVDQNALTEAVGGYAKPVSQFVSNGIFGFNPEINSHEYDLEKASALAKETGLKGKTLHFHLPKGLDVLGEHVRQQLSEIGVYVVVSYMEMDKLWESITSGRADLYFFGFKSDLGDSGDFLNVVAHSDGSFNVGNYSNKEVDDMIDLSLISMDPVSRLTNLQEAMRIITEDDVMGVPLFEYETLYAFSDRVQMQPRIDGLIYFDEITAKKS